MPRPGATTPTPIVSYATNAEAVQGIYFLDLNPAVIGVDTLSYDLDVAVAGKLEKYS